MRSPADGVLVANNAEVLAGGEPQAVSGTSRGSPNLRRREELQLGLALKHRGTEVAQCRVGGVVASVPPVSIVAARGLDHLHTAARRP